MSRIGKQPVMIPSGVEVKMDKQKITVKGPKGSLDLNVHRYINVKLDDKEVKISPKDVKKQGSKALWGTTQVLIKNMIEGVTNGFEKKLELNGTGYKVAVSGKKLKLDLGFSHSIEMEAPEGIAFAVDKNLISVSGIDKQLVGEIAAKIRSKRPVEPYKGKGLKYEGEFVRRKEGKKAGGEGAE